MILSFMSRVSLSRHRCRKLGDCRNPIIVTKLQIVTSLMSGPTFTVSSLVLVFRAIKNKLSFADSGTRVILKNAFFISIDTKTGMLCIFLITS